MKTFKKKSLIKTIKCAVTSISADRSLIKFASKFLKNKFKKNVGINEKARFYYQQK